MSKVSLNGKLIDKMAFEMELDGHSFIMDANEEVGGSDLGPRPKQLLLAGLIGCTGMDVMSILKKMKVELEDLNIKVECDNTTEHPKVYENIEVTYEFKGNNLPEDKIKKAVELSQERYCGVSAMLKKVTNISYKINIENIQATM